MQTDMEMLKQQLAELNARMGQQLHNDGRIYSESVPEPIKRGPGRPRKEESNAD
jgi:hypothetical protein